MGILRDFRDWRRTTRDFRPVQEDTAEKVTAAVVGASDENDVKQIQSYNNNNITFSGELSSYDYNTILRDKQTNIVSLYQLADYYVDADPIVHAIVKNVYVPFSTGSSWYLIGSKKTVDLYEAQYKKMRLREKLDSIMLEYWKYGNVYCYLMEDGNLITLPVHKCKIGNVSLNGEPIVDYDVMSIQNEWRVKNYSIKPGWIDDNKLETYFKGYPKEVVKAINQAQQYAQLDPSRTFVLQGSKESWQRYAIPFIASCLSALSKKELITMYEKATLNLGIRSFVHVTYGDPKAGSDFLPDRNSLTAVRALFQKAMSGNPLVVTNNWTKAAVIKPDLEDMYQWNIYQEVNDAILSAGGVSGIIATGVSNDGSTFASAQVSMQTVESRIEAAMTEFCDMMNRINVLLKEYITGTYNKKDAPEFKFTPLSLEGKKALREACLNLYKEGVLSVKTLLDKNGYNLDAEKEEKEKEIKDGTVEVFAPFVPRTSNDSSSNKSNNSSSQTESKSTDEDGGPGRNKLNTTERKSDEESAMRGKQPKPSSPEGSI